MFSTRISSSWNSRAWKIGVCEKPSKRRRRLPMPKLRSINNGNGRRLRQAIKNIASVSGIARNSASYDVR